MIGQNKVHLLETLSKDHIEKWSKIVLSLMWFTDVCAGEKRKRRAEEAKENKRRKQAAAKKIAEVIGVTPPVYMHMHKKSARCSSFLVVPFSESTLKGIDHAKANPERAA